MILQYKGISVYYEDKGQGHPIILLHGFLENSTMWTRIKALFLGKNRVICVDLLGHGQTGCLGYIHTMEQMADAVTAVLEYLKLTSYTVIGHSMGGYVALALAEKNPNAISRLCLMNSTYHADDCEMKLMRKRANKIVQTNFESMVRMSVANLFSSESRESNRKAIDMVIEQALKTPLQGYIAGQEGMMLRGNKFDFFENLKVEKLIVIGKKDVVVNGEQIKRDTVGTNIECQELALGHMSYIENYTELSYLLLRFVE
jgi:pimeloyl-ACP methyl ester carboxylesterase